MSKQEKDTDEKNNNLNKNPRAKYVETAKTDMAFFNFGLPSTPEYINSSWDNVIPKIKALHELLVRLNIYLANGDPQSGFIDFPESNKIIEYKFEKDDIDKSYIRFYSTRNVNSTK